MRFVQANLLQFFASPRLQQLHFRALLKERYAIAEHRGKAIRISGILLLRDLL